MKSLPWTLRRPRWVLSTAMCGWGRSRLGHQSSGSLWWPRWLPARFCDRNCPRESSSRRIGQRKEPCRLPRARTPIIWGNPTSHPRSSPTGRPPRWLTARGWRKAPDRLEREPLSEEGGILSNFRQNFVKFQQNLHNFLHPR